MIIPRTTLTMASRQSLANLESIRARRQRATDQVSSGLRVRRPSDDPADAAGVVRTRSDLEVLGQFRSSLQSVSERLRTGDTTLNSAVDLLTRANSLGSQAANFSQTAETRKSLGAEVDSILQSLITVANTEFSGKFLFSGREEDIRPFLADPTSPDGVTYQGDQERRSVALPGGSEIPVSLDGRTIFLNSDRFVGAGRTAGIAGTATPNPPVGVGITFFGGVNGTIFADLPSFFVAASPPTVPAAGDQVTVTFTSTDGSINSPITATLAGGETTAQIASALNAQIALNPSLAGIGFSDLGGNLKITESDTVSVGFTFVSSATGGLATGLESGGAIGGLSAAEIAAALNAEVASNPSLTSAKMRFGAVDGEIEVDGNVDFTFHAVDFPRGTGFVSGIAGDHSVGGASVNVFRVLKDLRTALLANDGTGIQATLDPLGRAVAHLSNMQGFYGSTEGQVQGSLDSLNRVELVDNEKLSALEDADLVGAISDLTQAQTNEEAALRVAARPPRSLFDFLA